jgi:CheY-like chemotaxis protein
MLAMLAWDFATGSGARRNGSVRASGREHVVNAVRVLFVDDHVDTVEVMQMLLVHAGYDVRVAYSGAEAISIAAQFKPDLAILDILLPDMTGYDLAPRLRAVCAERNLRLIALSSCAAPDHALAMRFDEIARKPIGAAELERMLRRHRPR